MRKTLVLCLFVVIGLSGLSARPRPEQQARLRTMSQRLEQEYAEKRARAVDLARRRNWPLEVQLADNRQAELMYLIDGRPEYYVTNNLGAAQTTRADALWPGGSLGLSISGSGYAKLGEWDGGAVFTTHNEFTNSGADPSRVTQADGASSIKWHATHVAGTLMGGGVYSSTSGMAYDAQLSAYDWTDDAGEMAAAAADGMEISNHSYGAVRGWAYGSYVFSGDDWYWFGAPSVSEEEDLWFGFYSSSSRDWDEIAYNAPNYLIVKSAGNDRDDSGPDAETPGHYVYSYIRKQWEWVETIRPADGGDTGYDTLPQKSVAKNILTIGAVQEVLDYTGPSDVIMAGFSSWGPADDGRIKPDVVGKGINVLSAYYHPDSNRTDLYAYSSGTSMSSPNVAGTLVLLQDYYQSLHSGTPMTAATLKALAIHTADEAGSNTGPDYQFGWGLVNAEEAAQTIEKDANLHNVLDELTLNDGGSYSRLVYASGTEPLKVTVVWTDLPPHPDDMPNSSLDPPDPVLVNDLDLRLTRDASTYYPWSLDVSNPSNAATQSGENNVDNVEQVYIADPSEGWYTITIDHDNTLYSYNSSTGNYTAGSQDYSLIISGTRPPQPSDLTAGNVQRNSADISWTEAGEAETWNVEYGTSGFSQGSGAQTQTLSNPFSLSDLDNNGEYDVYVQAVTGSETSVWTGPYTFAMNPTPPGHMLAFDGIDDHVDVGSAGSLQTVEFWMCPDNTDQSILQLSDSHYLTVSGGVLDLAGVTGESFYVNGQSGSSVPASEWSHVAVVLESAVNATQFKLSVGNSSTFAGKLDECRLWSDARSQSEIQLNLHNTLSGSETGLAACYAFDHASGLELTDLSSGGLDGALTNMNGDEWSESTCPVGDSGDWMTSGSATVAELTVTYEDGSSGELGVYSTGSGGSWLQEDNGLFLDKFWGVENQSGSVTATLNFDLSVQTLPSGKSWSDVDLLTRSDKTSNWSNITDLCSHTPTDAEPWFEITRSSFSEFQPVLDSPIPVTLSRFVAEPRESGVLLSWQVENNVNTAGFFVSRARGETGDFVRITDQLIPAGPLSVQTFEYLDETVMSGFWRYRLESVDLNGGLSPYTPVAVNLLQSGISSESLPGTFALYPNHPNPFNPATTIAYDVAQASDISVSVYNALGRKVRSLVNRRQSPGHYKVTWNGRDDQGVRLSSGIYLIIFSHDNGQQVQKTALMQ
ncbi:MAG: S8 family serine peptidase [candidate division KSB1 bacterium]|nr:S8 family serine peptidase [candidate division KSB1 bacterium]